METAQMLAETPIETSIYSEAISAYELERGKPMPNKQHAATQENLIDVLLRYKHLYRRLPELSLRLHGEKFVPDIALYPRSASDWHEPEKEMTIPPLLAIEIVSPSQSMDEMKVKADKYLAAGVKSVWLVFPALAGVMVFHEGRKAHFFSDGELLDDVLDIRVLIDEVFQ
ncbi:MAG: Uma2 family endonuclease [Candidatus Kapaibacteriota bacterium]|jgi:Uma2 family endonuclease